MLLIFLIFSRLVHFKYHHCVSFNGYIHNENLFLCTINNIQSLNISLYLFCEKDICIFSISGPIALLYFSIIYVYPFRSFIMNHVCIMSMSCIFIMMKYCTYNFVVILCNFYFCSRYTFNIEICNLTNFRLIYIK